MLGLRGRRRGTVEGLKSASWLLLLKLRGNAELETLRSLLELRRGLLAEKLLGRAGCSIQLRRWALCEGGEWSAGLLELLRLWLLLANGGGLRCLLLNGLEAKLNGRRGIGRASG